MKKYIYLFVLFFLLTGCSTLLWISYNVETNGKLKQVLPKFYITGRINEIDTSNLSISFYLGYYDSIRVVNLIPILNRKDTMYLKNWNYNSSLHSFNYEFVSSESIIKSNGVDLIFDFIFYKENHSRRYSDTLFLAEKDRVFKNYYLNYFIPRLH